MRSGYAAHGGAPKATGKLCQQLREVVPDESPLEGCGDGLIVLQEAQQAVLSIALLSWRASAESRLIIGECRPRPSACRRRAQVKVTLRRPGDDLVAHLDPDCDQAAAGRRSRWRTSRGALGLGESQG